MAANYRDWTGAVITASCTVAAAMAANYSSWTGAVITQWRRSYVQHYDYRIIINNYEI